MITAKIGIMNELYNVRCDIVIVKNYRNEKIAEYKCINSSYKMNVEFLYSLKFTHTVNCDTDKVVVWV